MPHKEDKTSQLYTEDDLRRARQEGERALAAELWFYIDELESTVERVSDQVQRESRQKLVNDLKHLVSGERTSNLLEGARWPAHETRALTALRLAAVHFWKNYDQADPSTAPQNEVVSEWLKREHKVSDHLAKAMATILRADNLSSGPRPKS